MMKRVHKKRTKLVVGGGQSGATFARKELAAYEFLCHKQEAKEWMEAVLSSKFPEGNFAEIMRDGIYLAQVSNSFSEKQAKIFPRAADGNVNFKNTQNIYFFLQTCAKLGLPKIYLFEVVDLFEKKNIVKVVFCIHAFAHYVFKKGLAPTRIQNLLGKRDFTEDEVSETSKELESIPTASGTTASFAGLSNAFGGGGEAEPPPPEPKVEPVPEIVEPLTDPTKTTIGGEGVTIGKCGSPNSFNIQTYDTDGKKLDKGGASVVVDMVGPGDVECAVTDNGNGTYTVTYSVEEAGAYNISIMIDGYPVPGSPFTSLVEASAASAFNSLAQGVGLFSGHCGVDSEFTVQCVDIFHNTILSGGDAVTVDLFGPNGTYMRAEINPNITIDEITVTEVEDKIKNEEGGAEDDPDFKIVKKVVKTATKSVSVPLEGTLTTDKEIAPILKVNDNKDGTYTASYNVKRIGEYNLKVYVNGNVIPTSPFHCFIEAGKVSGANSYANGSGLTSGLTDSPLKFQVQSVDAFGNEVKKGGANISVKIDGPAEPQSVEVEDNNDGSYDCTYIATRGGEYKIAVDLNGESVKGSPFKAEVSVDISLKSIKRMIQDADEDEQQDWISEIQDLKKNLSAEIRRNNEMEKSLASLDKKIELLIKNRVSIQEVLATSKGVFRLLKKTEAKKIDNAQTQNRMAKLKGYSNLFYLLQTEPHYLAKLVYLVQPEQMESFLDTVILTLFGDAFSPREEFLILQLFQLAINQEISANKTIGGFLQDNTVIATMIVAYNRRKQGQNFLKETLYPILKPILDQDELDLECNPLKIFQQIAYQKESKTGEKVEQPTTDGALKSPEVQAILKIRIPQLRFYCQLFLDGIINSLSKLPYGIRWICKRIHDIAQEKFPDSTEDDVEQVFGYFVYYRFINPAIVTPDAYGIIKETISPTARKNLVLVARVLQNLFNKAVFGQNDKHMEPLNDFIKENVEKIRQYFRDLIRVDDPEDYLKVDKYVELTQKTKPVILISLNEIYSTHKLILQNLNQLAPSKEDALRVIIDEMGPDVPEPVPQDHNDDLQLTLERYGLQETSAIDAKEPTGEQLFIQTRELLITAMSAIPMELIEHATSFTEFLKAAHEYAMGKRKQQLADQLNNIKNGIKALEPTFIRPDKDYQVFLENVQKELGSRSAIREQQRKEVKRLRQTLENLRKHQGFLNDQLAQYTLYLQDARAKHYVLKSNKANKGKVKDPQQQQKIGPFKFSYSQLQKKGVIVDSTVPPNRRKNVSFFISSDEVGIFDVTAKIAGVTVEKLQLELDDLLERQFSGNVRLELENITLDVNMTIHLINGFYKS